MYGHIQKKVHFDQKCDIGIIMNIYVHQNVKGWPSIYKLFVRLNDYTF